MQVPVLHRRGARALLHLTGVAALVTGSVLVTGGTGHADSATRPDVYSGDAVASAVRVQADRDPQVFPVSDALHVEMPYAISSLDSSGGASASASAFFPGSGALGLRGLLCTFDQRACLPLPDYPLLATASYPTTPDARAQTSQAAVAADPLSVTPGTMTAHADPSRVESLTQAAAVGVAGAVSVESATAHSRQAFEGGTLVVTADSVVKGLDIGAGTLHVDAVRSVAVSRVDGGAVTTSTATTTVSGATAGGQAVSIDSTGVHVAGNGDGGAAAGGANAALAALKAAGIDVRLVAPTKSTKDGAASAATGGLLVSFRQPVDLPTVPVPVPPGVPSVTYNGDYYGTVALAGAGVSAFALPAVPEEPWALPPPVVQPGTSGPVAGTAPLVTAPLPATAGTPDLGGTAPTVARQRVAGRPVAVLGVDLSHERLRLLALVLLGYPALVLLTGPIRLRPRARPARTPLS